jgi:hypothetical protein
MRRLFIGVASVLGATLLLAACGGGSSRKQQLPRLAIDYVDHARNHCCVAGLRAYNPHVRISDVDPRWATVFLKAKDKSGEDVGGAELVLHRMPTGWTVFNGPGTGGLGCGVPRAVAAGLELTAPPHCRR